MNVKKGIIELLIFPLFIISMMPLSVHADATTNTAPFIGVNVQVTGVDQDINGIQFPKVNFTYSGGSVPAGYVSGQLNCTTWRTGSSNDGPCDIYQIQNASGQGGNLSGLRLVLPLEQYILAPQGSGLVTSAYNYIFDYEFILDDNYKGYVVLNNTWTIYVNGNTFHHSIRQQGITQQEFSITDYQLVRSNNFLWNFPIESFNIVSYAMDNLSYTGLNDSDTYYLPIFDIKQDDILYRGYMSSNNQYLFIFYSNTNNISSSTISNFIDVSSFDVVKFESNYNFIWDNSSNGRRYNITLKPKTSGTLNVKYIGAYAVKYMPIYFNTKSNKYVSTDFALLYGLSNSMLDDISNIANGTSNSNSSVSSVDQQNDTFKDQSSDLITQEEEFTSNMKQNLQQIDTSFTFNNFGNKFMSSAVWVRDQYDHMITNTPFGTLVTFSLLLGLGLLIIGRTVNK